MLVAQYTVKHGLLTFMITWLTESYGSLLLPGTVRDYHMADMKERIIQGIHFKSASSGCVIWQLSFKFSGLLSFEFLVYKMRTLDDFPHSPVVRDTQGLHGIGAMSSISLNPPEGLA